MTNRVDEITLEELRTAKKVLASIFSEYCELLKEDLPKESIKTFTYEQTCVCEAMRQVEGDISLLEMLEEIEDGNNLPV